MSDSTFLFNLCGTTLTETTPANNRNLDRLERALTDPFRFEDGSLLTYHHPSEECFIQRPLNELPVSTTPTGRAGQRQIQIHVHRRHSYTEPASNVTPQLVTTCVRSIQQHGEFHANISFTVENAYQPHGYDQNVWPDARFSNIDFAITVDQLHQRIETSIEKRVKHDSRLGLLSPEAPKNFSARYTLCIEDPSRPGRIFQLDSSQPYFDRISSIQDLFLNPRSLIDTRLSMTAHVRASLDGTADDEFDHSERSAEDVVWSSISEIDSRYPPKQVRIGSTRVPTGKSNDVPTEYALVANINEEGDAIDKLLDVDCWSIDHFCITAKSKRVKFSSDFIFFPPFEGVNNLRDIEQIIFDTHFDHSDHPAPIRPGITFNTFDQGLQDPPFGATLDDEVAITVVIKFVNHLNTKGLSAPLQFRSNMQLFFDGRDTDNTVKTLLNKELKEAKGTTNLFKGKLKNTWKMELWVIPQGLRQLYRFQDGAFTNFLRQEMVDAGNRTAYMECHIWPDGEDTAGL